MTNILEPFRAVGIVTGSTPFAIGSTDQTTHTGHDKQLDVITSVGSSFHIYWCGNLNLKHVSDPLPDPITSLAKWCNLNFVGADRFVHIFNRYKLSATLEHSEIGSVLQILLLTKETERGPKLSRVVAVGTDNTFSVWTWPDLQKAHKVVIPHGVTVSCACLPVAPNATKIIIGSTTGVVQMWSVDNTPKLLHTYGGFPCGVHTMEASSIDNIVALGLVDGTILVHNLHNDETLVTLEHSGGRPITSLAFRRDGPAFLASGNSRGEVCIWDLDKQELQGKLTTTTQIKGITSMARAHARKVTSLYWFAAQPLLLSAGADNCMRMFQFNPLGQAQLLKQRKGHFRPITVARFFSDNFLLSAAEDRQVHVGCVDTDQYTLELSQGHVDSEASKKKKDATMLRKPPVSRMSLVLTKLHSFPALVTLHEKQHSAQSWLLDNYVMDKALQPPHNQTDFTSKNCATAVCATRCGHFCVVGMMNGQMNLFNLQSGKHYGFYEDPLYPSTEKAHNERVVEIHVIKTNSQVISLSTDADIKIWEMRTRGLLRCLHTGYSMVTSTFALENDLLAVGGIDYHSRIYDINTDHISVNVRQKKCEQLMNSVLANTKKTTPEDKRDVLDFTPLLTKASTTTLTLDSISTEYGTYNPIRTYDGHTAKITAMNFSADQSLLLTASEDKTLRYYHVSAKYLVNLVHFEHHITSMDIHPKGLFILTTHKDQVGVYLWTNMLNYGYVTTVVTDSSILLNKAPLPLPSTQADKIFKPKTVGALLEEEERVTLKRKRLEDGIVDDTMADGLVLLKDTLPTPDQTQELEGLIRFSNTSKSKWSSLPYLDLIKSHNQPIKKPKKNKPIFFIPTIPTLQSKLQFATTDQDNESKMRTSKLDEPSPFESLFVSLIQQQQYSRAVEYLMELSESKIDFELQDIQVEHIPNMLEFFTYLVQNKKYYDLVQSTLNVFLKQHGKTLMQPKYKTSIQQLQSAQDGSWDGVWNDLQYTHCLLKAALKQV